MKTKLIETTTTTTSPIPQIGDLFMFSGNNSNKTIWLRIAIRRDVVSDDTLRFLDEKPTRMLVLALNDYGVYSIDSNQEFIILQPKGGILELERK